MSNNFTLHITFATTSTFTSQTLTDNIFFNNQSHWPVSGNLTTSISDHRPYDNLNKNKINDKPNKYILLRFYDQNQNNKTAIILMK